MRSLFAALVVTLAGASAALAQPGGEPAADPDEPVEAPTADPPDGSPEDPSGDPVAAPVPVPNNGAPPPQPVGPAPEDFGQMGTTFRAHTGLLARAYSGVGVMSSSSNTEGIETAATGNATSLGLTVGYSLRPRLAVHFDVILNLMPNTEVKIDGVAAQQDATGGLVGAGPGVSYYLPPKVNAYLAGSLLLFDRFITQDDVEFRNTRGGFGANFVFGKEWWLGGSFGLGIVGQVFFGLNKDDATEDSWSTLVFALNISATYN